MKAILKLDFKMEIEHLLVEIIFGQIFELPSPPYKQIYYGVLIVDGYKTSKPFADALAEAVNIIFRKLEDLDTECFDRFSEWFSFHLSSIDWKWDWEKWSDVLSHPESSHQRRFINEVIEQCIRLSYHEKAAKTLPESFHLLLPAKPTATYAYANSRNAAALLEKIYERASGEVLSSFLEGSDVPEEERLEMLLQVLLHRGQKSSTHILKLFERYLTLLQSMISNTNQKIVTLSTVQSFWVNCHQNIIIIADKLMTYCIVDNVSIVKWILSSKSGSQLKQYVVFSIF